MFSVAHIEIIPEKLAMRTTVYNTTIRDVNVVIDPYWVKECAPTLMESMLPHAQLLCDSIKFVNDNGEDRGTLADRVRDFVKTSGSSGDLRIEFSEPTFMVGHRFTDLSISSIERIKIVKFDVSVDVARTIRTSHNYSAQKFITYLLRNILEPDERCVLVGGGEFEPSVIVALRNWPSRKECT